MGADLYIESIHRPLRARYEPFFNAAVVERDAAPHGSKARHQAQRRVNRYFDAMYRDGYFRDSYNVTNLLHRLGLSWWRDVTPLCNSAGYLEGENLRSFRQLVGQATLQLPTRAQIQSAHGRVDHSDTLADWHRHFQEKRVELLRFLDRAIELNSPIRCSL